MKDRSQLGEFGLNRNIVTGDLLLMANGLTRYKSIIGHAFPTLYWSRTFEDKYGKYDWGTYIKGANIADESAITDMCKLLQHAILIDDDLDQSFALALHTRTSASGGYERTPTGQVVYKAKSYNRGSNPGSLQRATELAGMMVEFIERHPTYREAELIAAVPPSNPNKYFDLPTYLATEIAKSTGHGVATSGISKTRITRPMKECRTLQEKVDNIKDAFQIEAPLFVGEAVVLIDDIYETGFSMNEVGRMLYVAGAQSVLGLAATKTTQDLT